MSVEIEAKLSAAIEGLRYRSETDAPFTIIRWDDLAEFGRAESIQVSGKPTNAPVEECTIVDFFGELRKIETWFDDQGKADARKYHDLLLLFSEDLKGSKVFKVGNIEKDVLIVGQYLERSWVGLRTKAVET